MKRFTLFAGVILLLAVPATVRAQYVPPNRTGYRPYSRTLLSPYLNMLRGGDPAANYYLGVIPEMDRRVNYARVRNSILELEQQVDQLEEGGVPVTPAITGTLPGTGHATTFLNTGNYFPGALTSRPMPQAPQMPKLHRR
jgi:hypothetical protein